MYADCGSKLTVTGSMVGMQIWLLRTLGNLGGQPAEVFNYAPETWLAPAGGSSNTSGATNYQSIVGLPPVL